VAVNLEEQIRAIAREEARRAVAEVQAKRAAEPDKELLSPETAAKLVDLKSPSTIREWVRKGLLTRHGKGERIRVDRDELLALMKKPRSLRHPPEQPALSDEAARILERAG
jgi:excisionase family DNA binding protein